MIDTSDVRPVLAQPFSREALVLSADARLAFDLYIGGVSNGLIDSLLAEPAVSNPPRRVWRDWVLVGVVVAAAVLEAVFRNDMVWRPWPILAVALLGATLLWRRQFPLGTTIISMGTFMVLDQLALMIEGESVALISSAFLLVHFYALFRWGSGRHCAYGLVVMVAASASSAMTDWTGFGDAIGGAIVLLVLAVLGLEVRHLVQRRQRDRDEVKTRERELLARDLHDTVAHHVSAIAVQAQAGRVVGATNPAAALDALAVIEREASKTLAEMRSIVGTLRDAGPDAPAAELTPQSGLADILRLADAAGPHVEIEMRGVDGIGPIVGAALYRVAQESITNARRHAVDATHVNVLIDGDGDCVRLVVVDDGIGHRTGAHASNGFGLIGMTERAELLGGVLRAGPNGDRGWRVDATIPLGGHVS